MFKYANTNVHELFPTLRLKYKLYHRVAVNESNQNEAELPAAESCMADEDEEDGEVGF